MLHHVESGYRDWIGPREVEEGMASENGFLGSERMTRGKHSKSTGEQKGENRCLETGILNSSELRRIWWTCGDTFYNTPRETLAYGKNSH